MIVAQALMTECWVSTIVPNEGGIGVTGTTMVTFVNDSARLYYLTLT